MSEYTLPTEPGYYLDREDDLWRLTVLGDWVFPEDDCFSNKHERYAPFTRLMTESQWEAKREHAEAPKWECDICSTPYPSEYGDPGKHAHCNTCGNDCFDAITPNGAIHE